MDKYSLKRINNFLPEKIKTRLSKTTQERSGNEIYKRRNCESTRVLLQYITWKK